MTDSVDSSGFADAPIEAAMAVLTTPATPPDPDLVALADLLASTAANFINTVELVAKQHAPDAAIALLLLEVSSILSAGARLGAISDVVPEGRFEPDAGLEPQLDTVRDALGVALEDVDHYLEVFDPYAGAEVVTARISDDLSTTVADLLHGLAHHAAGRPIEALWWWQHTYLTSWGSAASGAMRALQSLVAHVRLGAVIE